MEDSNSETLELQNRRNTEEDERERRQIVDELVNSKYLHLDENSIPLIRKHLDYFVNQSRCNERVKEVRLSPHLLVGQDIELWDKVGQAVGNFQALSCIHISTHNHEYQYPDGEEVPIPDWEILARILSHVRQSITLNNVNVLAWGVEESRSFARAIHGHPTITSYEEGDIARYAASDALYSALATLPALESICLSNRGLRRRPEDESALTNPESLTELLRIPSLRYVCLDSLHFTLAPWCHAIANALIEGTGITNLDFTRCSFTSEESAAIVANGLAKNTSVVSINVEWPVDVALIGALTVALPSNSTLRELSVWSSSDVGLGISISAAHLSPFFLALGKNTGLKSLVIKGCENMDESLCTAIKNGLALHETLESLVLKYVPLCDDNATLWCRAFSFLRSNKALKSLEVVVPNDCMESCLSAFRIDIVAMLQENTSIERLTVRCYNGIRIKAEEVFALVAALQQNTALRSLKFTRSFPIRLTDDGSKQLASLLKKNYALETLPDINLKKIGAGDVGAILRLNKAGRRYLIEDGSSISKGVEVLSRVKSNINCVFMHLLENPRLCDRRAVEMVVTAAESNGGSTNPTGSTGGGGKREQASVPQGRESRRRLA
jgi:hypothetical protein